jgi:hypothetical protein
MSTTTEPEVDRLEELLDRYRTAVRTAAEHYVSADAGYEQTASQVVDLESTIAEVAPTVPLAERHRLLGRYDDVGYVRDLLAVPRHG